MADIPRTDNDRTPAAQRTCRHEESLWGRCTTCGMTWQQQAARGAER